MSKKSSPSDQFLEMQKQLDKARADLFKIKKIAEMKLGVKEDGIMRSVTLEEIPVAKRTPLEQKYRELKAAMPLKEIPAAKNIPIEKVVQATGIKVPEIPVSAPYPSAVKQYGQPVEKFYERTLGDLYQQQDLAKRLSTRQAVLVHVLDPQVLKVSVANLPEQQKGILLQKRQNLKDFLAQPEVQASLESLNKWQTVLPSALKIYKKQGGTPTNMQNAYNLSSRSIKDLRVVDYALSLAEKLGGLK